MKRAILSYGDRRFILGAPICLIGRDPDCDLVLDDPSVSRKHGVIVRTGNRFVVLDYKSSNGLFVNDEPVFKAELSHGDNIRLGDEVVTFNLQSRFKFGPDLQVENYDGLLSTHDFQHRIEEIFSELATEKRIQYNFIFEFDEDIKEAKTSQDLLDRGLNCLLNNLKGERGFLALFNEKEGEMDVRSCEGVEASSIPGNPFYVIMMKQAFVNSQIISTTEALFEYFYQEPRLIFLGIGSAICAPIYRFGVPCGIVYIDRKMVSEPFREVDERLLAVFTYRLSLALDNMMLVERLKENLQLVDILVTQIGEGGAAIKCEICGVPIKDGTVEDLVICLKCHTIHHRDCWNYNGGCPIYGCDSNNFRTLDAL